MRGSAISLRGLRRRDRDQARAARLDPLRAAAARHVGEGNPADLDSRHGDPAQLDPRAEREVAAVEQREDGDDTADHEQQDLAP